MFDISKTLPWEIWLDKDGTVNVTGKNGEFVCQVGIEDTEENRQYAEFIVASANSHHDLLAACKYVAKWLCDTNLIEPRTDSFWNQCFVKANNAVLAAIAKTKGASHVERA
jgi:hypothetical protein